MNDKQIIIDGVNVAECMYFDKNAVVFNCIEDTTSGDKGCYKCKDNPNCYYKQLKRAEQKLDKIKKVCNKFIPDHYKILLIINGGIVEE